MLLVQGLRGLDFSFLCMENAPQAMHSTIANKICTDIHIIFIPGLESIIY